MPPHCDSLDGPVVTAAKAALTDKNVDLVLPFVPEAAEEEVRAAFERTQAAQAEGGHFAHEVATCTSSTPSSGCTERVRGRRSPDSNPPAWMSDR